MSIIQTIRERAAVILSVIIAVSLIAFVLQDAFTGRGGLGSQSTTVGAINGKSIEAQDYQKMVTLQEAQYTQAGLQVTDAFRQNILDGVWNQMINEQLLDQETSKLGIRVGDKELNDMFFGDNPPQDIRRLFTDPNTGVFDKKQVAELISQLKTRKNDPNVAQLNDNIIPALLKGRAQEKYYSLLMAGTYLPKWLTDKQAEDNAAVANISYASVPYSTVADSSVTVSDADIIKYISERKDQFKQEKSRNIVYVTFDASPSSKDTLATLNEVNNLAAEFASTSDPEMFLNRVGTDQPYFDGYILKSKMAMVNADSIRALAPGQVFGPYQDGNHFVYARMVSKRMMPDSVKCRHILISTQTGLSDADAKQKADSIAKAIQDGANFAALAAEFSDDPGSKENGGEYEFSAINFSSLAKEFAETVFYGKTGDKKVVKTQFGYHYIEVMSQKAFEEAYKVAYLAKPIVASAETDAAAFNAATQFVNDSRSLKAFSENARKNGLQEFIGTEIREMDFSIPGIGASRSLVKEIFQGEKGQVLDPIDVDNKYVVAAVTDVNEEGLISASKARPAVELIIRNQKKAEVIRKKLGNATTLEALTAAGGTEVLRADSISFASTFVPGMGSEPKVVGAAFDKNNTGKVSQLIDGTTAVYLIKVESVGSRPVDFAAAQQMREGLQQQLQNANMNSAMQALKKKAKVKDERSKFF